MAGAAPKWHRASICVRYRDIWMSEEDRLKAGNTQANRNAGRSVGVWAWGPVRRILNAKKKILQVFDNVIRNRNGLRSTWLFRRSRDGVDG